VDIFRNVTKGKRKEKHESLWQLYLPAGIDHYYVKIF